jgi:hypothetical protein
VPRQISHKESCDPFFCFFECYTNHIGGRLNKKIVIIVVFLVLGLIILGTGGFTGWYFFIRKSPEGEICKTSSLCAEGTTCISGKCSSGKAGSVCSIKEDCKTAFCASGRCTEGTAGSSCATYKDCVDDLLCKAKVCAIKPSYTKYFDKIEVSQMKAGIPPGPDNIPVPTTTFTSGQAIEVDFYNSKNTTGEFWVELINIVTGEKEWATDKQTITSSRSGTGFQFNGLGDFDLNVYFNGELVHNVVITVN